MATDTKEQSEQVDNSLGMSDEDFLKNVSDNYGDDSFVLEDTLPENDDVIEETPDNVKDKDDVQDTDTEDLDEEDDGEAVESDEDEDEDESEEDDADESDEDNEDDVFEGKAKDVTENELESAKDGIDYKAEYERIFKPFKANGREIKIEKAEDAITLMQMGANYNKKMAALKPNLRLMKMLEQNKLLDEAKLSYLIDLDKKDPEAINKLIQDSGIDPMDLDTESASGYKPKTYTVDEKELELDMILEEIQGTESYNQTIDIVGNKWDVASKQTITETPQLLNIINEHVASGIYDIIAAEVEKERVFGRLNGLSDIEAYKKVGDAIQARGGFNHLGQEGTPDTNARKVVTPKPRKADDPKLRSKKRAASSTRPTAPSKADDDFNPLSMSDEEFSKMVDLNLM